ncbi:MAG: DUF1572 family protein [Phycisphaerae bacterium]
MNSAIARIAAQMLVVLVSARAWPLPLDTTVTYQGQLKQFGQHANDSCDFEFRMFDAPFGGTQIGPTLTFDGQLGNPPPISVVDGLFMAGLDFGVGAFQGDARYLEVSVRCPSGTGSYETLSPRQPLTAAPYALYALDSPASFNLPLEVTLPADQTLLSLTNSTAGPTGGGALVGRSSGDSNPAIRGVALGNASAGSFECFVPGSTTEVLDVFTASDGIGVLSQTQGNGSAGMFLNGVATNPSTALHGKTIGTGRAGFFELANSASASVALEVASDATGDGFLSHMTGTARAGLFRINVAAPANNAAPAVEATTNGGGPGMRGFSPNNDGVLGRTGLTGTFLLPPGSARAGIRGEGPLAMGTTDSFGVAGTQSTSGSGVLGIGEQVGHGVVGVSGSAFQAPPRSLAGVWGMTAEDSAGGFAWPPHFNIEGVTGPKGLIGVLGQGVNGVGVWGESLNKVGIVGTAGLAATSANLPIGSTVGVYGYANGPQGLNYGVFGSTPMGTGTGVLGIASASAGSTTGVSGSNLSSTGRGVAGFAFASPGANVGVYGESQSTEGTGVHGRTTRTTGTTFGVRGEAASSSGTGVQGLATRTTGSTFGVVGQTASNEGTGVYGLASATNTIGFRIGVKGEIAHGEGVGVMGVAPENSAGTRAVQGINGSNAGASHGDPEAAVGVEGYATNLDGATRGVRGVTASANGIGTEGLSTYSGSLSVPPPIGVLGTANSTFGTGVKAVAANTEVSAANIGLLAEAWGGGGIAVFADAKATAGLITGAKVIASRSPDGVGIEASGGDGALGFGVMATGTFAVYGESTNTAVSGNGLGVGTGVEGTGAVGVHGGGNVGVRGTGTQYGLHSVGDCLVEGNCVVVGGLSVTGAKSFRIDHPLDPENRYLVHFCAEAPEPVNVYSGNVTTDAAGRATVALPAYFEAVNRDFRYQLTVVHAGDEFVLAQVSAPIAENRFAIRTSRPHTLVSWQVTATRDDPWMRAHAALAEIDKPAHERGRLLHPELFGHDPRGDPQPATTTAEAAASARRARTALPTNAVRAPGRLGARPGARYCHTPDASCRAPFVGESPMSAPVLDACVAEFRTTRAQCEKCFAQLSDDELHVRINPHQNSIAVIIQHVAGNMLSRWTDFLTTDGEKPDRDRESEFEERRLPRAALMALWERGWAALFGALAALRDEDLQRTVHIRTEPYTVFGAISRQIAHYNLHLGQIQVIGKHLRGAQWQYLSIPPGGTAAFNRRKGLR